MGKVFRLHKGNDNIVHWQASQVIGYDAINDIKDPEDHSTKNEITSVPSPFARIDLVKTAFEEIGNKNFPLDGNNIYHKMVSDSLDVGEIFFNIEKYKDLIQIIYWDKNKHINELLNSHVEDHRHLGRTLDMYLKQDATAYNFDKLDRIYLLNYLGPDRPSKMNIIGATSPCTIFFSSANDLGYVSRNITFGADNPFDSNFRPLYTRDIEYIKYLWAFKMSYKNFGIDFKSLDHYLNLTYSALDTDKKNILDKITETSIKEYDIIKCDVDNNVEVIGLELHHKPNMGINSEFEIDSSFNTGSKPLVLPCETGNSYTSLIYTQDNWTKNSKAPFIDKEKLHNRVLPYDGSRYPYLTISDFLEDVIIRMPFEINKDSFFNGNISNDTEKSYLLPITDTFFRFFTFEDLQSIMPDGKKMIEMREQAGGITVILRIPIKGNKKVKYIEYKRLYFNDNIPEPEENKGAVIDHVFGMGVLPCVNLNDSYSIHYRVALFDKANINTKLKFHKGSKEINYIDNIVRREKDRENAICSIETYIVNDCFDRITLKADNYKNIIIPLFKKTGTAKAFTFAIDFGTSNTHIEYSVDGKPSSSFDINSNDKQMIQMHKDYLDNLDIKFGLIENYIPDIIGDDELYKFPLRTAFAEHNLIDYEKPIYTIGHGNIAFRYEKAETPDYNNVKTDLKWSIKNKQQVKLFLANIFIMIRNKVLLNNGDLNKTKIIWFYPASMTEAHYNIFKQTWDELFKEYISNDLNNIIPISESLAPYNFYIKKRGAKSNVVTIDIGGGTTDVYVVEDSQPKLLSSMRFAANAIFGDGYSWDASNNGFVSIFKSEFEEALTKNDIMSDSLKASDLLKALKSIEKTQVSSDIAAFFFALEDNKFVKDNNIPSLNFIEKLEDNDKLKYVFIIFYSSILYYVANLMKSKGLKMPLTIAFSGNGSRTLKVLSRNNNTLSRFVRLIFEKVYNEKYHENNDLEIIYEDNPKVTTCKGGILNQDKQSFESIESLNCSLLGTDMTTEAGREPLATINEEMLKKIVEEVNAFINFIFDIDEENQGFFSKRFNADSNIKLNIKRLCTVNLLEYAKKGLELRKAELKSWGAEERIEETLFFMPFVGMLNNLAREIAKMN